MNDTTRTIRPYQAEDIEAVIGVWQRANALAHPFLAADFVAEVHQAMRDIYLPNAETHVLELDGRVAGFIALIGNEIGGLFLDPALHGRGHGRALVDHAVTLKGPLTVEVFRDNMIGRPFYERYGFQCVADELHEPSGHVSRKMAMPGV
ncbi:GNAT family N-acetyltransferase [Salipiger sp. 1_MG-2023]|uniref:GNAT family N-acetyltransferase n=1 Tax=Salipiger sp. 1_MG-2023 TaxID=3062665 RepID=UPI0026E1296C|nr:GNAT family N-acetyltransferase [Salipiger sp. 1_MG-2023]MDO6587416.1 GNAT family N-acetyltransferase [Salipiger sp. 1_MG-2023]